MHCKLRRCVYRILFLNDSGFGFSDLRARFYRACTISSADGLRGLQEWDLQGSACTGVKSCLVSDLSWDLVGMHEAMAT